MSYLKLYRPLESKDSAISSTNRSHAIANESDAPARDDHATAQDEILVDDGQHDDPAILPFRPSIRWNNPATPHRVLDSITRARVLHENRCCPYCEAATVEPVELRDPVYNRNLMPVPGTATLVGFHCESCDAEWPI